MRFPVPLQTSSSALVCARTSELEQLLDDVYGETGHTDRLINNLANDFFDQQAYLDYDVPQWEFQNADAASDDDVAGKT
jgi:hypothetical protein